MSEGMEKIKIEIKELEPVKFSYNEQEIFVNSQLSLSDKMTLFRNYIDVYFRDGDIGDNYIEARYGLILGITDLCTNIDIDALNLDDYVGSLWKEVYSKITNYNEFMSDIYNITKSISDNNAAVKSVGGVLDKFTNEFMNFIKTVDLSSDGIQKLISEFKTETTDFNKKYINPSLTVEDADEKSDIISDKET